MDPDPLELMFENGTKASRAKRATFILISYFGAKIGTFSASLIQSFRSKKCNVFLARKLLLFQFALMAWHHCWVIRFINYLAYYEADPEEEHHYQGDATDR